MSALTHQLAGARAALAQGLWEEADHCYQHARQTVGDDAAELDALARLAGLLGHRTDTEQLLRRAVQLAPQEPEYQYHLGVALEDLGQHAAARAVYAEVIRLQPGHAAARLKQCVTHLLPCYDDPAQLEDSRRQYEAALRELDARYRIQAAEQLALLGHAVGRSLPFLLAYQGRNDRELQDRFGRLMSAAAAAAYPEKVPPRSRSSSDGRIKVGLVTAHVKRHSVWKAITRGICEHLDRRRFALTLYDLGESADDQTAWARRHLERFVTGPHSVEEWLDTIRADRPDALLYPELGMNPLAAKLGALRLAPVQAVLWGHPDTSGYPTMDYYLSGELLEPPDGDRHYTERLVRLPGLGCCFQPLSYPEATPPTRAGLGLPEDAVLYVAPHRLFKFLPEFDSVFPRIARQVAGSVFVFFEHEAHSDTNRRFRQRLERSFAAAGVSFEAHCRMLPRVAAHQFFQVLELMDVYLDSLGFSGFNTAVEALRVGLPVVTWEGPFMRGRLAAAVLRHLGLAETVADSPDRFVEAAVRLGRDRHRRAELGRQGRQLLPRLYNDRSVIRALEQFLETATTRHAGTQPPAWHWLDARLKPGTSPYRADYVPRELLELCHLPPRLVLDVGCSMGATGQYLKQRYPGVRVLGVEPNPEAAEKARTCLDAVFAVPWQEFDFAKAGLAPQSIDTVILADVLEHMINPWQALQRLHPWLAPDAQVLVSLPNVRNLGLLNQVAQGRWEYTPFGLLDVTHLRFFTLTDARLMFQQTGFEQRRLGYLMDPALEGVFREAAPRSKPLQLEFDRLVIKIAGDDDLAELCTRQFLFNLRPERPNAPFPQDVQRLPEKAGPGGRLGTAPAEASQLNEQGIALARAGRLPEALAVFQRLVQLHPDHADAYNNLGNVFKGLGRFDEAVQAVTHAVRLKPGAADLLVNLGYLQRQRGRFDEAATHFRQALQYEPNRLDALKALASVRFDQGNGAEAVAVFRQAQALAPHDAEVHNDLGNALRQLERHAEAVPCYRDALRLKPDLAPAHANLANLLAEEGKTEEARESYRQADRLRPNPLFRILADSLLPVVYDSMEQLEKSRRQLEGNLQRLEEEGVRLDPTQELMPTHFYLAYQGRNDRDLHAAFARLGQGQRRLDVRPAPTRGGGKIRIGFLSKYLRKHTIGHLNAGVIAQLARQQFDVTLLSVGWTADPLALQLRQAANHFVVVPPNPDAALRTIAGLGLDILFYPEIGMDALTYTLAFSRLAPVQVATWGHPVTTGLPTIDYFLSSQDLETDGAEQCYTEKLVRLSRLAVCYERPVLPAQHKDRGYFGLPEQAHVYLCPQTLFKFHPEFDDLLAGILRGDPDGLLVLLEGKYAHWTEVLRRRFGRTLAGVLDRVRFLPAQGRDDFLSLLAVADVMLDPIHFGGGNTSYEGLALGVPIVTLPSAFLRGRLTYAMYRQMGLLDLVARDHEDYQRLAVRLGMDPEYRADLSRRIQAASSSLYDDVAAVRELERFLISVV